MRCSRKALVLAKLSLLAYEVQRRDVVKDSGELPTLTLPVMTLDGPTCRVYACWLDVGEKDLSTTGFHSITMSAKQVGWFDVSGRVGALKAQMVRQEWLLRRAASLTHNTHFHGR